MEQACPPLLHPIFWNDEWIHRTYRLDWSWNWIALYAGWVLVHYLNAAFNWFFVETFETNTLPVLVYVHYTSPRGYNIDWCRSPVYPYYIIDIFFVSVERGLNASPIY